MTSASQRVVAWILDEYAVLLGCPIFFSAPYGHEDNDVPTFWTLVYTDQGMPCAYRRYGKHAVGQGCGVCKVLWLRVVLGCGPSYLMVRG